MDFPALVVSLLIVLGALYILFKISSRILKSNTFWIIVGISFLITLFTEKSGDNVNNKNINPDKSIQSGSRDKYIAKDGVFCLSEKSLEHQYQMLAAGIMQFSPQCFSATKDIKVVLVDFKMLGGTAKVMGADNGKEMWTTSENLIEK